MSEAFCSGEAFSSPLPDLQIHVRLEVSKPVVSVADGKGEVRGSFGHCRASSQILGHGGQASPGLPEPSQCLRYAGVRGLVEDHLHLAHGLFEHLPAV